jgi:phosphatidylinositol-3-phosphatase
MELHPRSAWCAAAALVLAAAPGRAQPIPVPDHVVIVFEENHAYGQIVGNPAAPYINGLLGRGASLTNSFAVTHPSQPNYLALFSGSTQGVTSDNTPANLPFTTPNLGAELFAAGRTFTGYSEGLPSVGYTGDNAGGSGGYWRKHNPWVNWQQVGPGPYPPNTFPPAVNQPFTAFLTDYATLPTVAVVVPTQINDMHDGTVAQADAWLAANLDGYVQWARTHNSLFILTFDEDDGSSGNHITTLLVGPMVTPGVASAQFANHYTVLATVQDMYGLPRTANSVGVASLGGIWAPVPEPAALVLTALGGLGLTARCVRGRAWPPGGRFDSSVRQSGTVRAPS